MREKKVFESAPIEKTFFEKFRHFRLKAMIGGLLAKHDWAANLHFELNFRKTTGYIVVLKAIDEATMANKSLLRSDANKIMGQVKIQLEQRLNLSQLQVVVYFVNRSTFTYGYTVGYSTLLGKNQSEIIEELATTQQPKDYDKLEVEQLERLRTFPLKPNQYLMPMYKNRRYWFLKKRANALCLLIIEKDMKFKKIPEKKKLIKQLSQLIIPGGPIKRIIIKKQYQCIDAIESIFYYRPKR